MSTLWPLPLERVSASSLATFGRCPEQWRRRYILGQKEPPGGSAVLGSAAHGSAEVNYRQKSTSGIDLPIPEVELAYAEAFDQEVDRHGGPGEIDWTMKIGQRRVKLNAGQAKDKGLPLTRAYRTEVAPAITPVAAEEWFDLEIPGVPVPIKGKIDLITDRSKVDIKFGAQAKQLVDIGWRMQGLIYLLVDQTTNLDGSVRLSGLSQRPFEWHSGSWGGEDVMRYPPKIWTPATAPDLVLERTQQNMQIARNLIKNQVDAILAYWDRFGPDEPWPGALQHSWACSFCGFRDRGCFWWNGAPQELTLI